MTLDKKFVRAARSYALKHGIVELDRAKKPYLVEVQTLYRLGVEPPWRAWRSVWMGNTMTVAVLT